MKTLLTTIAAVLLVGCEPPKPPDISIHMAANEGNVEAIKHHLAAGTSVNAKDDNGETSLHWAAIRGHKETAELLIAGSAEVNAKDNVGRTPLDLAKRYPETADILRKHGAKTSEELKAERK